MTTLLNDQPLGEGEWRTDGLGFRAYASVLSSVGLSTPGPFTIGVFGEWGTGKTSLLRMIKHELDDDDTVACVWFNAWKYERDEHLIVPLLHNVLAQLESEPTVLKRLTDGGRAFMKAMRGLVYGLSIKGKAGLGDSASVEVGLTAKDAIDRSEKLSTKEAAPRSFYLEAFEDLRSAAGFVPRVALFIDDLDRCFPDSAIELLEQIKLILAETQLVVYLGASRTVIEGYLEHRYTVEFGLGDYDGAAYLDKIVQLPFYLPQSHSDLTEFFETILDRLEMSWRPELDGLLPIIRLVTGGNPRRIIRFVNNLLVDACIAQQGAQVISLELLAVSRGLQQRWPQVYLELLKSEELCNAVIEWTAEAAVMVATEGSGGAAIVAKSYASSKDLRDLLAGGAGRAWLHDRTRRDAANKLMISRPIDRSSLIIDDDVDIMIFGEEESKEDIAMLGGLLVSEGLSVATELNDAAIEEMLSGKKVIPAETVVLCVRSSKAVSQWMQTTARHGRPDRLVAVIMPGAEADASHYIGGCETLDLAAGISEKAVGPLARAGWL